MFGMYFQTMIMVIKAIISNSNSHNTKNSSNTNYA